MVWPLVHHSFAFLQQPADLLEALKGQGCLSEVETERATPDRREAHRKLAGDFVVRVGGPVGIKDELNGFGTLLWRGSNETRAEQRPHVVGTPPCHWAT